jgi:NADH-quinone oxidoreductase subunit G
MFPLAVLPMQMFASVLGKKNRASGKRTFHVAVMPCTAKKFEAARKEYLKDGIPDVDAVITTRSLSG